MLGYSFTRSFSQAVGQGFPAMAGASLGPPSDLDQLLLDTAKGDPYYSESEDPSGAFTHMLADRSKQAGDLREKRLGHCLDFNGVDQYIEDIPVDGLSPATNSFSVFMRLKFNSVASTQQILAQKDGTGTGRSWLYFDQPNGEMRCFVGTLILSTGFLPLVDTWYDVAVTWDHTTGVVTFYANNASENRTGLTGSDGTGDLVLGASKIASDPFDGKIYDFRFYQDKVLTAEEFSSLRTFSDDPTGISTHYWMQEESGATIYDSSGNGNHGTITGYAASQRVTDAGVQYSVANEVGQNPIWNRGSVPELISTTTITCRARFSPTTQKAVIFDSYNGPTGSPGQYVIVFEKTKTSSALQDATSLTVDGTNYTALTRDQLATILADGEWHSLEIQLNTDVQNYGIPKFGNYPNFSFGPDDFLSDIKFDGDKAEITSQYMLSVSRTVPPLDSSTTQDALGGELTYQGRCPMYGLAKHVAWQGNGTDTWVEIGESAFPATADWSCELHYYHVNNDATGHNVLSQTAESAASTNRLVLTANGNGAGVMRLYIHDTSSPIALDVSGLNAGEWNKVSISRAGDVFSMTITNEDGTETTGSQTETSITIAAEDLGLMQYHSGFPQYNDGRLGPVSITTGGVTTTYVPVEGTRDVAKITSDGSANDYIVNAVTGGSLATLYTQNDGSYRLPHIENGANYSNENRLTKSEQLTVSPWSRSFLTFDEVGTLGIAKTFRANAAVGSSTSPFLLQAFTTTNVQKYVYSVCAKAGTLRYLQIMDGGGFASVGVNFDLELGVYKETSDTLVSGVYDMVDLGDGWYRCILEMPANATAATSSIYWRLIDDYDATRAQAGRWLSGDHLFVSQHQVFEGVIADLPGYSITGDDAITEARLVPCDPLGGTPDGTPQNIAAGDHPKGIQVDWTGGKLDPLSYGIGLDAYTDHEYNDVPDGDKIAIRGVSTYSSDRHASRRTGGLDQ